MPIWKAFYEFKRKLSFENIHFSRKCDGHWNHFYILENTYFRCLFTQAFYYMVI